MGLVQLIPGLDVQGGQVVRAVRGLRATYQPVRSRLVQGCEPAVIGAALLAAARGTDADPDIATHTATAADTARHVPAPPLYLADLDALQGRARQTGLVSELLQRWPGQTLWVDAGFAHPRAALVWRRGLGRDGDRVTVVLGSETLESAEALQALRPTLPDAVLSLDRRAGQWLDVAGCWRQPAAWPARVIVMTLERVGSAEGPDLDTLAQVRAIAPQAQLVGSGGLRHAGDVRAAAAAGASAWLVASAWHDGGLAASPRT